MNIFKWKDTSNVKMNFIVLCCRYPDERKKLKQDFPDIFVPPPDNPPTVPATAGSCRNAPTATQTSGKENSYFYSFNTHVKKCCKYS